MPKKPDPAVQRRNIKCAWDNLSTQDQTDMAAELLSSHQIRSLYNAEVNAKHVDDGEGPQANLVDMFVTLFSGESLYNQTKIASMLYTIIVRAIDLDDPRASLYMEINDKVHELTKASL